VYWRRDGFDVGLCADHAVVARVFVNRERQNWFCGRNIFARPVGNIGLAATDTRSLSAGEFSIKSHYSTCHHGEPIYLFPCCAGNASARFPVGSHWNTTELET